MNSNEKAMECAKTFFERQNFIRHLGLEFKNNMLRPASGDQIIAIGKVLKNGRRLIITEAEIMDAGSGKLLSKMTTTIMAVER